MKHALLAIIIAFVGYSVLNISLAGQKIGLETAEKKRSRGIFIWITATAGTTIAAFIVLYAVSLGSVALVGAMAGTGLVSLALFSRFVMKEKFGARELTGVVIVIIAAFLIGGFTSRYTLRDINIVMLVVFLGLVIVLYVIMIVLLHGKREFAGIIIGGFSGALGGFIPMFQKISTSDIGENAFFFKVPSGNGSKLNINASGSFPGLFYRLLEVFANPYAAVWIFLSIISVIVVQFAYKKDQAIRVIPAFSINYILVPIIGGVLVFKEELHLLQWLGVVLILTGMLLITVKSAGIKNARQ